VRHLRELNETRGLAVLLIEQNARLALELCSRAYVLEAGRIVAEGPSAELAADDRVSAAYLGGVPRSESQGAGAAWTDERGGPARNEPGASARRREGGV
jgi:branched-chain amino acid transport system ATP-binding protein